jgi:hypothetical protein
MLAVLEMILLGKLERLATAEPRAASCRHEPLKRDQIHANCILVKCLPLTISATSAQAEQFCASSVFSRPLVVGAT